MSSAHGLEARVDGELQCCLRGLATYSVGGTDAPRQHPATLLVKAGLDLFELTRVAGFRALQRAEEPKLQFGARVDRAHDWPDAAAHDAALALNSIPVQILD